MSRHMVRGARFIAVLAAAIVAGIAAAMGSAVLGHEILVLIFGENLASIDDTLPMRAGVALAYVAGIVAGIVVLVIGWRRFVRRPKSAADPH